MPRRTRAIVPPAPTIAAAVGRATGSGSAVGVSGGGDGSVGGGGDGSVGGAQGTVAAEEGGDSAGAVGSSIAEGAGMAGVQGFAVAYTVGPREMAALVQGGVVLEQARAAGGKARHALLADERRPHIEQYRQRRDEGMLKHVAEQLALSEMDAAGITLPKSDRGIHNMFAGWETRKSA